MKEEKRQSFDPNAPSPSGKLFGLPYDVDEADILLIPVPWGVTVSYRTGTALAPEAILKASGQIDLYSDQIQHVWNLAVAMLPLNAELKELSDSLRQLAGAHIHALESGSSSNGDSSIMLSKINDGCENMNVYVKAVAQRYLREGKIVGLVGGDHSSPLGLIRALAEKHNRFGILQIDAHADLRKAYEGFLYSHASIMYNALKIPAVGRLVQVGIRDWCEEEAQVMSRSLGRIKTFSDHELSRQLLEGTSWSSICASIIQELPPLVYISFDIDGLDPKLCPNTGTPVPGGLQFTQIRLLLQAIVASGRKIIGFDLNEVAPGNDEWDANVGARILWELCQWCGVSNGLLMPSSR